MIGIERFFRIEFRFNFYDLLSISVPQGRSTMTDTWKKEHSEPTLFIRKSWWHRLNIMDNLILVCIRERGIEFEIQTCKLRVSVPMISRDWTKTLSYQ